MRTILLTAALAMISILAIVLPLPLLTTYPLIVLYSLWIATFAAGALGIGILSALAMLFDRTKALDWPSNLYGSQVCLGVQGFAFYGLVLGSVLIGVLALFYAALHFGLLVRHIHLSSSI